MLKNVNLRCQRGFHHQFPFKATNDVMSFFSLIKGFNN